MNKSLNKILYPDCCGHFSLSPFNISLPFPSFFKHITDKFPFKAHLYFNPKDMRSSINFETDSTVPPISLAQGEVTVLKKVMETSLIASPFFEDTAIDVSISENLINIPVDRYLSKIEIKVVELTDPTEKNKLFSDTCVVYEKINLAKVKYCHDAEKFVTHLTQTFLYTKCQTKGKTGIKMDMPTWKTPSGKVSQCMQLATCS